MAAWGSGLGLVFPETSTLVHPCLYPRAPQLVCGLDQALVNVCSHKCLVFGKT